MMSQTINNVILMVGTVVDLALILIFVPIVLALVAFLEMEFQMPLLVMAIAMMSQTINNVILMEETVVELA